MGPFWSCRLRPLREGEWMAERKEAVWGARGGVERFFYFIYFYKRNNGHFLNRKDKDYRFKADETP